MNPDGTESAMECARCGAPHDGSRFLCRHCGATVIRPATIQDELLALEQLGQTATQLAHAVDGDQSFLGEGQTKQAKLASFWQNAFIPRHGDAQLRAFQLAIQSVSAGGGEADAAVFNRATTLLDAYRISSASDPARLAALPAMEAMIKKARLRKNTVWFVLGGIFSGLALCVLAVAAFSKDGKPSGATSSVKPAGSPEGDRDSDSQGPDESPPSTATKPEVKRVEPAPERGADTPLDSLAKDAISSSKFSIADGDAWALYPGGTTECGTDVDGKVVRLDLPAGSDEFETERLKGKKPELLQRLVGSVVEFSGSGNASGDGFDVDGLKVSIGKYNFAAQEYTLTIAAIDDSKWPITTPAPNLVPESMSFETDREVAKIGDKKLTIAGQQTMTHFLNRSSMALPVKVPAAEAEAMKSDAPTQILMLMKFNGLGFHKSCRNDCSELLGTRTCVGVNDGFGQFYRADLVGYRVVLKGKTVAEKQPPAKR